jgi:glycosyltransferase involved in cell wall biosynthesis
MELSVALAVYNEESNLEKCLYSIKDLTRDIVVVDGGSTDNTVSIAQKFKAKIVITDNPPIFHINKQKALDNCKNEWILQLDADEIVTPELGREIESILANSHKFPDLNGYYISRRNYFWGRPMTKGGLYPDRVIRLVKKSKARFPCISVHEQIEIDGRVGCLTNPLDHFAYRTIADYWRKADSYINLTAMEMKKKSVRPGFREFIYCFIYQPTRELFNRYFRHKGFLDGWQGLAFAVFSAMHYPKAYLKYIRTVNQEDSRI